MYFLTEVGKRKRMKIIHYALGFYPYRTGGLTQYVMDIMYEQQKQGHTVGLLWPGQMRYFRKNIKIQKRLTKDQIYSYELINPLPVPLLEGVKDISAYIESCDVEVFRAFLKEERPDVLHIHTFMGLYEELLEATKELGVRVIYTTHDYYALCPKVNLLCGGRICQTGMTDKTCSECDMNPLSLKKISIMQSPLYRFVKDSKVIKNIRKKYLLKVHQNNPKVENTISESVTDKEIYSYHLLREKYENMLKKIDIIHCNSSIAETTYKKFISDIHTKVLSITNHNIVDKRKKRVYNDKEKLCISFLGSASIYKGFYMLIDALNDLYQTYPGRFALNIYFPVEKQEAYMQVHEPFKEGELDTVLDAADVVVVPSLWSETFGFVALEAISRGVPVIITENVGAKDIITERKTGVIIKPEKKYLTAALEEMICDREILQRMNENICNEIFEYDMCTHVKELVKTFYHNVGSPEKNL